MLICSIILVTFPDEGGYIVIAVLDISLLLYGLRLIIYYFTMARYMVGGIMTFYKSIIVIDFGLFIFNLNEIPQKCTMIYLVGLLVFSGMVDLLRSLEERKLMAKTWKYEILHGMVKIVFSIFCLFFINSMRMMMVVYSLGLVHAALVKLSYSFKKTAIVYVES